MEEAKERRGAEVGSSAGAGGSGRVENGVSLGAVEDSVPIFAKELVAGGVAGGVAKTAVAPLERVKILFQTRRAEFQSAGLVGSFRRILNTEGLLGFYRGNGASVARIVPYAALHYMAYEQYRRWIILQFPNVDRGPILDLVSGSFAGGTSVIFTYPLDLVRTKLAYQVVGHARPNIKGLFQTEQIYKGILDCISKIYKGALEASTGVQIWNKMNVILLGSLASTLKLSLSGPSLLGIFPYSGLKFYFYETMKSHVHEDRKKDISVKLICGSIAGLLGQTITYPLDVVRRQMQVQAHAASNSTIADGTVKSLILIVQNQGWKQLFSGLSINYLKVVPSVAIGFTIYDVMKLWLNVPSREEAAVRVTTEERSTH